MHLEAKVTNSTSQSFATDTFRLCQIRKCLVNTPCSAFQISLDQNSVSWNFKLPSHRDAICVRFLLCPDVVGQMKRCHQVSGSSLSLCVSGCEMGMSQQLGTAGPTAGPVWAMLGPPAGICRAEDTNKTCHRVKSAHYRSALQKSEGCLCSWLWSLVLTLGTF